MEFKVEGMTCGGCVSAVERVMSRVAGVTAVRVSLADKRLVVEGNPDRAAVIAAVQRAGYTAT